LAATRLWPEAFPHGNRTRRPQCSPQTHWTEPMYSNRQSPFVFKGPTKWSPRFRSYRSRLRPTVGTRDGLSGRFHPLSRCLDRSRFATLGSS
jgi:hypothetical protein